MSQVPEPQNESSMSPDDRSAAGRRFSLKGLFSKKHKEKSPPNYKERESMSERGAFRVEYTANGVPYTVENKDWPPGVKYEKSSTRKMLESKDGSLGDFYQGSGGVVPGGETAGNEGPDPDWIPGLTEEQKKQMAKDKSGRYGKCSALSACVTDREPVF